MQQPEAEGFELGEAGGFPAGADILERLTDSRASQPMPVIELVLVV
jgi:hypothetical protein